MVTCLLFCQPYVNGKWWTAYIQRFSRLSTTQIALQHVPTFTYSHIHSYTDCRGCHVRWRPAHQEQLGVQCLAQGHFALSLKEPGIELGIFRLLHCHVLYKAVAVSLIIYIDNDCFDHSLDLVHDNVNKDLSEKKKKINFSLDSYLHKLLRSQLKQIMLIVKKYVYIESRLV